MPMRRAVISAAMLLCSCKGTDATRPGPTGSAAPPPPPKLAPLEAFPRCAQKASFEILPDGPKSTPLASAKVIDDHLLVQSRPGSLKIELDDYDLKARTWRP